MHVYLNLAETLKVLREHPTHALITCCDGPRAFSPKLSHTLGLRTYLISTRAFAHFQLKGKIELLSYNERTKAAIWKPAEIFSK